MSDNKKYYWLKLPSDFFEDKAIKRLRQIAGGDTYTIIYLKMLLKSLEDNGKLYYEGIEDTISKEIALDIDESEDDVQLTINYLVSKGLMQVSETVAELSRMNEMIGKETDSARRVRKHRMLHCNANLLHCNTDVTKCNTEKDIDLDIEKEKDINTNIKNNTYVHNATQNAQVLSLQESWFNTFWNCYPNKKDKKRSKQKFLKACKTEDDFHNIMAGLNNTVVQQAKHEGKDFIPMASTWLNGERWNDPPYTPKQQKNNNTQESWSFMDEDI